MRADVGSIRHPSVTSALNAVPRYKSGSVSRATQAAAIHSEASRRRPPRRSVSRRARRQAVTDRTAAHGSAPANGANASRLMSGSVPPGNIARGAPGYAADNRFQVCAHHARQRERPWEASGISLAWPMSSSVAACTELDQFDPYRPDLTCGQSSFLPRPTGSDQKVGAHAAYAIGTKWPNPQPSAPL